LHQQRNIFEPFGQRRNPDQNRAQPVVQIFTETPGQHLGPQISIGRGDQDEIGENVFADAGQAAAGDPEPEDPAFAYSQEVGECRPQKPQYRSGKSLN